MIEFDKEWSKNEFKVYLFLFCINANNSKNNKIKSVFRNQEFKNVYLEFNKDNDYQSIQKMCFAVKKNQYSNEQLNMLFNKMKTLCYLSGKKYNSAMNNTFMSLERILTNTV